ncbi:hypothetical protein Niako_3892 [Niastella koreensis GR20-10]|uniref:Uncharacterized protein n=1 Tax=Niastella koreensis (strain DSM 17620 / KACC 11465 / NBRC 106392 / GR20-10) TaxID=700598 RepID=G8T8K5_NIAKG|nr:hypothetical protein Niako_3892 [Niastella koreensis GR20-10]
MRVDSSAVQNAISKMKKALKLSSIKNFKAFFVGRAGWTNFEPIPERSYSNSTT